jgi:hypothetical protein
MKATRAQPDLPTKEQLVDGLLKSLYYRNTKKEDRNLIEQIRMLFDVPADTDLRDYLVKSVNFSRLFAALTQLIEPFAQMLNEIYTFLANYKSSAQTAENHGAKHQELRQLIISEGVVKDLQFDLDTFPTVQKSILQRVQVSAARFDHVLKLNHNCSPIFLAESLLDFGYHEHDARAHRPSCRICEEAFKKSFEYIFLQMRVLVDSISDDDLSALYDHLRPLALESLHDFKISDRRFQAGIHAAESCPGYDDWKQILHKFLGRFERITTEETWFEEAEAFLRFFALPFWEKRSQLYEVWTLIHFLSLLGDTLVLNIREGMWQLMYARSEEPIAWIRTDSYELEVWFQRSQEGKTYADTHVMPDMMVMGRSLKRGMQPEPLVLIECKEREGESLSDMQKLASHYRNQVRAKRYIYCNYLRYSQTVGCRVYRKRSEIVCDGFRPGEPQVAAVDKMFTRFVHHRIKQYMQQY